MEGQNETVAATRPGIFHEVHFAVIESSDFCNDAAQEVAIERCRDTVSFSADML